MKTKKEIIKGIENRIENYKEAYESFKLVGLLDKWEAMTELLMWVNEKRNNERYNKIMH